MYMWRPQKCWICVFENKSIRIIVFYLATIYCDLFWDKSIPKSYAFQYGFSPCEVNCAVLAPGQQGAGLQV